MLSNLLPKTYTLSLVLLLFFGLSNQSIADERCKNSGFSLQVLGSGGPIADDGKASTAYVLWLDGKSKLMVDVGGGAFLRFGEAGANYQDLEWIGLSHFHTDHSSDLPALLKSGYFSGRQYPLLISGPEGNDAFPSLNNFLAGVIGRDQGAYPYLSGYLDGSDGLHKLNQKQLKIGTTKPELVMNSGKILIEALGVPHGIVPSIAYKISYKDKVIVLSSDQNGNKAAFIDFIKGADTLVMHMPVPEGVSGAGRKLHAPPSVIGSIASRGEVRQLVLSHFMARSLRNLTSNLDVISDSYDGEIVVSDDLSCIEI